MIKNFACKLTQELWDTGTSMMFSAIAKVATRKLDMFDMHIY